MFQEHHQQSDIARLLAQIDAEYVAGRRALTDLAIGTARHHIITAKMERMGELHQALHTLVGDDAIALIAERLDTLPDENATPLLHKRED